MNFVLREGAVGQEVARFQKSLCLPSGGVDGKFGPATKNALKDFQEKKGLTPDGIYGPATQAAMGNEIWPGVDVSHHNGDIDWKAVSKSQKFAIIKISEGSTFVSSTRLKNYEQAKRNGVVVGGYHFARLSTGDGPLDAEDEAMHFARSLKAVGWEKGVDLAPVLDIETGMKVDDQYNVSWANSFIRTIKDELGVNATVYTAKWYFDAYMAGADLRSKDLLSNSKVWWANYTTDFQKDPNLRLWTNWDIWQWTGSGSVPGIAGKVDRNWLPGGNSGIQALKGV